MPQYRDKPCQACGWKFPGFHICLDLPLHVMRQVEDGRKKEVKSLALSESRVAVVARSGLRRENDPRRIERNKEIVRLYQDEDFTMREVSEKLKIDSRTVMNVLHNAQDKGDVIIRRAVRRTGKY